jgi:hypothetical protein
MDPLARLEQLVPLCGWIRQGEEYKAALAQATSEVQKAGVLPERIENVGPVLHALHGSPQFPAKEVALDLDKLETAGHTLQQCVNAKALRDARFAVADAQNALVRVEGTVTKAWSAHVQKAFGNLQRLGGGLADIPDTKAAGTGLQQWATQALKAAQSVIPDQDSIRAFNEAKAQVPGRLAELSGLGIDEAVSTFLLEAAQGKATLAAMTPEILAWLQSKQAQSRFSIQLH